MSARIDQLQGVWNILPTPFTDDGELDPRSLGTLTDFVIGTGVDGLTILGVLGEAAKLLDEERMIVIEEVCRGADGRVPVCAGVSAPSTERAVAYARAAEAAGVHSIMLAPPALSRPNDTAVRRHFLAVAEAVDLPIVVQDHPPSSGVWMSVELLVSLAAESPSLRVIKLEDEPTPTKIGQLLASAPSLRIMGGLGGVMLLEELRRGAVGTMTGFAHPGVLVDIVGRFRSGDVNGATEIFYRYLPLIRFENQPLLNLAIRKLVYSRRGAISSDRLRSPGTTLDVGTIADLDDLLLRLGL